VSNTGRTGESGKREKKGRKDRGKERMKERAKEQRRDKERERERCVYVAGVFILDRLSVLLSGLGDRRGMR
jgi:hypothetical protein